MNTIKFSIFRADGSKVPTLKKAFLVKEYIYPSDLTDGVLHLEDGTEWTLITEHLVQNSLVNLRSKVFCIVSYQAHTHGNFAVARLVTDKPIKDITTKDMPWLLRTEKAA